MTARRLEPPPLSRRCIEWAGRRLATPELADDAEELFAQRAERDGERQARSWYRRQARACLRRALLTRQRGRKAEHVGGHGEDPLAGGGLSVLSWLDVKLAVRMLGKYPGLSLVSVFGMSVAIAIGAGGFSLIHALVGGELPMVEGGRVVTLQNADIRVPGNRDAHALHDFLLWREELESVVDLSAFRTEVAAVEGGEGGIRVGAIAVMTASGFRMARVSPAFGRTLLEEDERPGAAPVVLIGYDEWQRRFGGDREIIGQTLRLGTTVHTLVGVMREGFRFPVNHGYWVPLRLEPTLYEVGGGPEITVFGRLSDGATIEQARAELTTVSGRMVAAYPETHEHLRAQVVPYVDAFVGINSPARALLAGSVQLALSLLLIVVAVNVAILVYARTAARMGEIAVRCALGASRRRVVAQLFAEALVLSGTAALLGVAVAALGFEWFQELINREDPVGLPFWVDLGLSPTLVVYAAGLAIVAAVIMGVLPALKATERGIRSGLQALPTGGSGLRLGHTWTALIVTQVAIAVAVLPYAVYVLGPSITRGFAVPDYPVEEFLQATLTLDELGVTADADLEEEAGSRFLDGATEFLRRLEAEPEVSGVAFASHFPGTEQVVSVEVQGYEGRAAAWLNEVDTNLFTIFDVTIMAGRGFVDSDAGPGSNAVIVDRVFAEEIFGDGEVLGRHVRLPGAGRDGTNSERGPGEWLEIVGVVPDFTVPPAFQPKAPKLYRPLSLAEVTGVLRLAIRMRRDTAPVTFMGRPREIAAAVAPDLRLNRLATAAAAERERTTGLLLLALVIVAVMGSVLLLSAAGVYAMMSFIVASRRREIGIRAALGAAPGRVLIGTFKRASAQLGAGAMGGLALAEGLARAAGGSLLFAGESTYVLPTVVVLLMSIGLLAAVGPALRGLAVEPTEALRQE